MRVFYFLYFQRLSACFQSGPKHCFWPGFFQLVAEDLESPCHWSSCFDAETKEDVQECLWENAAVPKSCFWIFREYYCEEDEAGFTTNRCREERETLEYYDGWMRKQEVEFSFMDETEG